MKNRTFIVGLAVMALLDTSEVSAAACCGGASAFPTLITEDHRAEVGLSVGHASVIADAEPDGRIVSRLSSSREITQSARFSGALLFSDALQLGMILPVVHRDVTAAGTQDSAFLPGDVRVSGGWEFLPEYEYSTWKPRAFAFIELLLPTGRSIDQSTSINGADVTGKGFTGISAGTLWLKKWQTWDVYVSTQAGPLFLPHGSLVRWAAGGVAGMGVRLSKIPLRLGIRLGLTWESLPRQVWNMGTELGYAWTPAWSTSLSYDDETLLRFARSTVLSRTLVLSLRYQWVR